MKISWEDFKSLCLRFKEFFLNFFVSALYLVIGLFIAAAITMPIHFGLLYLGVPHNIAFTITRIIWSIAPFFPTMYLWKNKYKGFEEDIEGAVMDCCFTIWIFWLAILWQFL